MGNCFSTPSPPHHGSGTGPGPSPGIARLPDLPAGAGGVHVSGLPNEPGLSFPGLPGHGLGRPSLDPGTGPRPLPDPSENTPSNVKVTSAINHCPKSC